MLPLGKTGGRVSVRMNQNVQIQTSKSVLIPLLPLKIISCWNGAIRKIYCTSFSRQISRQISTVIKQATFCIEVLSTTQTWITTTLQLCWWIFNKIKFPLVTWLTEKKNSVPLGQASSQWRIASPSPLSQKTYTHSPTPGFLQATAVKSPTG